jgi:hypothetical protein
MATLSTSSLDWLADEWEKLYGSATLSGIVGDLAHKARGGYHISRQDQPKTNYSVTRKDDKLGPSNRASAIDMTMNTSDIKKCHIRLRNAWKNRAKDVRMKYINAWNGWDGEGDAGRYDVVTGNVGTATSDHKWHIHLEIRRRYVNDRTAMDAILSILQGESLEQYLGQEDTAKGNNVVTDQFSAEDEAVLRAAATSGVLGYAGKGLPAWEEMADGRNFLNAFTKLFQLVDTLSNELEETQAKLDQLLERIPPAA